MWAEEAPASTVFVTSQPTALCVILARTSIAVLLSGCILIRLGKGYVLTWSWTLLYVIGQAFVSAVAGVVIEFL